MLTYHITTAGAIVIIAGSGLLIFVRGYLVPGTPQLTKKYLPKSVLYLFGKQSEHKNTVSPPDTIDAEGVFRKAGLIQDDQGELVVTSDAKQQIQESVSMVKAGPQEQLAKQYSISEIEIIDSVDGIIVLGGGEQIAMWPSSAALVGDLAIKEVLEEWLLDWEEYTDEQRGHLISTGRILFEVCPICNGNLAYEESTFETCCSAVMLTEYQCTECGDLMMELPE